MRTIWLSCDDFPDTLTCCEVCHREGRADIADLAEHYWLPLSVPMPEVVATVCCRVQCCLPDRDDTDAWMAAIRLSRERDRATFPGLK